MNNKTITDAASVRLVDFLNEIADLLLDPMNLIPLVFAFGIGWLYSLAPWVSRIKRLSDKKFHVYLCNLVCVVVGFLIINYDVEPRLLMSSLMFVAGASILIPAAYFKFFHK